MSAVVKRIIVKVQVSVAGNNGSRVLIYGEGRDPQWEGETSDGIRAQMKGRAKAFFWAEVGPHGFLGLTLEEAPWQPW